MIRARFNPRTREGATKNVLQQHIDDGCFNPRTREGATMSVKTILVEVKFQSTHP